MKPNSNNASARPVRHLDLFSGIGGFALACRMVGGIEPIACCEREPFAQRVLRKHWPDVPICNDIHEMKGTDYGTVDIITGGFPCQPYSLAGKRRGNEDDRALWPEMLRVIREARPTWVLGENVPGIIKLALDGVLADLEGEGYACEPLFIPACAVDARHRRGRVWIVAHADGINWRTGASRQNRKEACDVGETLADAALMQRDGRRKHWQQGKRQVSQLGERSSQEPLADTNSKRGRSRDAERQHASNARQSSISEESDTGGTATWLPEPNVGRVANGVPFRVDRLRGLGNAIVPQVAAEIIRCMMAVDKYLNP